MALLESGSEDYERASDLVGFALDAGRDDRGATAQALAIAEGIGHREWTAAALRALGIASSAVGDAAGAIAAFRRGLEAAEGMPLFTSWAASRLAMALLETEGPSDEAEQLVALAASTGTPLSGYEASWAQAELACARGDDRAAAVAAATAAALTEAGYLAAVPRLRDLEAS
ncbi:MAG: hypothetical protein ACXWWX_06440, partial [Actinomycetota bacterium]